MGKPTTFSEPYVSPDIDRDKEQQDNGVSPRAAKWVYVVIAVMCAILAVLLIVALHVPRGE